MKLLTSIATFGAVAALFSSATQAGLDVTAYEKLAVIKVAKIDQSQDENTITLTPVEFPERFLGLNSDTPYHFKSSFDFRAGSYSGYNWWRNELAKLAGFQPIYDTVTEFDVKTQKAVDRNELRYDKAVWNAKKGPFWELIDFSDAEGVIGPVVCKRVYKDFLKFKVKAAMHPSKDFRESYRDWMKAFSMCANDGAIVFS